MWGQSKIESNLPPQINKPLNRFITIVLIQHIIICAIRQLFVIIADTSKHNLYVVVPITFKNFISPTVVKGYTVVGEEGDVADV